MTLSRALLVIAGLWLASHPVASQPLTAETLRGEWIGRLEGYAAANDAGERAIRFWGTLGTDGSGRARYVVNGKADADMMSLSAENDTLTFTTKERARVSLKLTAGGELAGTWTIGAGAPIRIRMTRQAPARAFDRAYAGRGQVGGTGLCESLEMKLAIKDGRLTGRIDRNYGAYSSSLDMTGEAWANGDVDMSLYRNGVFAGYSQAKIEGGRFKQKLRYFSNCADHEFDLR